MNRVECVNFSRREKIHFNLFLLLVVSFSPCVFQISNTNCSTRRVKCLSELFVSEIVLQRTDTTSRGIFITERRILHRHHRRVILLDGLASIEQIFETSSVSSLFIFLLSHLRFCPVQDWIRIISLLVNNCSRRILRSLCGDSKLFIHFLRQRVRVHWISWLIDLRRMDLVQFHLEMEEH